MLYVAVGCRVLLVIVFAVALASKVSGREAWRRFATSVTDMTTWRSPAVPFAVAAGEAAVIVLTAVPLGWAGAAGFTLAAVLLGGFTVATLLVMRRGAAVPCRCFGASETPLGVPHVVRNLVLVSLAVLGLVATAGSGAADVGIAVLAGLLGAALGVLFTRWDDLVSLV
ncbi:MULTISPECIES: MauE/DoxX family redox-associated membrane protein [unclassified Nonomuraea]|uniref:MauE/DoxX family redox-associated membrane protein n=1 Tax=unclassified Nonomuraea TaxID=2593643 RepID=UPI0033DF5260